MDRGPARMRPSGLANSKDPITERWPRRALTDVSDACDSAAQKHWSLKRKSGSALGQFALSRGGVKTGIRGAKVFRFLVSNEFGWLWVAHGYRAPKLTNVKALGRTPLLQWSNIGAAAWNSLKCSDERATVAQRHGTRLARYGRTCRGHSPENQTHYLSGAWLNCTGHLSPLLHSLDGGCRGVPRSARPGWFASRAVAVSKPSSRAT